MDLIDSLRKRPLYLLLPVAAIALAAWSFWPRALPVESATVARAPLTVSFTEEGRTRLRQRYQISVPTDGFIQRVVVEPGDEVKAGATVAILLPSSARLLDPATQSAAEAQWRAADRSLAAAQAALAAARAESTRRRAAFKRVSTLAVKRLVSVEDLDAARTQSDAAAAAEKAAGARVEESMAIRDVAGAALKQQGQGSARTGEKQVLIRAPSAGRVVRRHVESEGPVRTGQLLLEVGDPGDLEVEADILSADAVRIAPGTAVELLHWGGDTVLSGHVRVVEPGAFTKVSALGVEEQRVKAIVALDSPQASRSGLGDGYRVEARFLVWRRDAVLQIPIAALFREGEHWSVYAIEQGRARLRQVELGRFGERAAELRKGLGEGSQVVLYPGDKVRDGSRVAPESR